MQLRGKRVGLVTEVVMMGALCLGWRGAYGQAVPPAAPLTVDHDPAPSPDPDPAPGAVTAPQGVGAVTKEGGKYTLRQDAYEVRLNASVFDGTKTVQNLDKDAFHVYEDGVPQAIISLRHEDLPVSIGLLIDSSGSM